MPASWGKRQRGKSQDESAETQPAKRTRRSTRNVPVGKTSECKEQLENGSSRKQVTRRSSQQDGSTTSTSVERGAGRVKESSEEKNSNLKRKAENGQRSKVKKGIALEGDSDIGPVVTNPKSTKVSRNSKSVSSGDQPKKHGARQKNNSRTANKVVSEDFSTINGKEVIGEAEHIHGSSTSPHLNLGLVKNEVNLEAQPDAALSSSGHNMAERLSSSNSEGEFEEVTPSGSKVITGNGSMKSSEDVHVSNCSESLSGRTSLKNEVSCSDLVLPCTSKAPTQPSDNSDDSESDWEEVEELPGADGSPKKNQLPEHPVEITLDAPSLLKKRKKKGFDIQAWFRRQVNRFEKEAQTEMHKVHLLCLLCHGFYRNGLCNNTVIQSIALSIVPPPLCRIRNGCQDLPFLNRFMKWFTGAYSIDINTQEDFTQASETLATRLATGKVASEVELVLLFVTILRALGAEVRFVISLQPISYKASGQLYKTIKRHRSKVASGGSQDKDEGEAGTSKTCRRKKPSPGSRAKSQQVEKKESQTKAGPSARSKAQKTKNSRPRNCASKVNPEKNECRLSDDSSDGENYIPSDEEDVLSGDSEEKPKKKKVPTATLR